MSPELISEKIDKCKGALVGLAVGDALGMYLEFQEPGEFEPIDGMMAGGPFDLPKGYWTDDTSMALCLADSLLEKGGYDSYDVMARYRLWYDEGYRSSTGICFDIGNQVRSVLFDYAADPTAKIPANEPRTTAAGNGSIMRLAPIVIASYHKESEAKLYEKASISARETHYSWLAQAGTAYMAGVLWRCLEDNALRSSKEEIISQQMQDTYQFICEDYSKAMSLTHQTVSNAKSKKASELKPTGYIIDSLEAAVWGFLNFDDFKSGMLAVVNLGGDSDTIGAIYGQIAGTYYGYTAIPQQWRDELYQEEEIAELAEELYNLPECNILRTRFEEDGQRYGN